LDKTDMATKLLKICNFWRSIIVSLLNLQ